MLNTEGKQEIKEHYETSVQSVNTPQNCELSEKKLVYKCERCEQIFSKETNLKKHINTVHKKIKAFSCQICQKSFTAKHNLEQHISTIHEKKILSMFHMWKTIFTKRQIKPAH